MARMEIYLDANATTPVLPRARDAALAAMSRTFGNPSSTHGAGLRARAMLDEVRARARRVLGAPTGRVTFTSGATEGIQTAVLSALMALKRRRAAGEVIPPWLLYGATEHKAVPAALRHWNDVLGLDLEIHAIPVDADGRHVLAWLQEHAAQAGLVCTMAANNETGVVSDLDGIERAIEGSGALWMVDGVQALGKLDLALARRAIAYAPFSGHKLYAPKGIGLLYVREDAPFTPLLTGGGQEDDLRAGTENMAGVAALGAVLQALEEGDGFKTAATLAVLRDRLLTALEEAFPGLMLNAPLSHCLPTTLNFSVRDVRAKVLLDLFDAAGIRVSGGSACSASRATPSDVLSAMGLSPWRASNAVRLSIGPLVSDSLIAEACRRIRSCGQALRSAHASFDPAGTAAAPELITRWIVDGACCYLVCPPETDRCVVVDPLPELTHEIAGRIRGLDRRLVAVLDTHSHGDHASSAPALWSAAGHAPGDGVTTDDLGWPRGQSEIGLGSWRLIRMATPGHTADATALLLQHGDELSACFVGDTVMPGALGRTDFAVSQPQAFVPTLRALAARVGHEALLLPGHDEDDRHATTLAIESRTQALVALALNPATDPASFLLAKAALEAGLAPTRYDTMACGARVDRCAAEQVVQLSRDAVARMAEEQPATLLVDVRESYERSVDPTAVFPMATRQSMPVSALVSALARWLALPREQAIVFYCRSGSRSAQAARALRRLGRENVWSLSGGLVSAGL
jgi:cysteine sulfinate desulfinase/cysteine desulfurase-like protein/glyoxylase-like metal-dependent hydrolase (beta-lactamase superfamily II)/rhodanese-related sulfurtransferase